MAQSVVAWENEKLPPNSSPLGCVVVVCSNPSEFCCQLGTLLCSGS